ncbi:hypothetical protein NESM_000773700 [Novymonas esmeraldas]|uniref:Uncharacterized protein n=1 Tax=Novymonas esmeraldas TaxID=1808958 RepID=A0AAW0EYF3_9TRYP
MENENTDAGEATQRRHKPSAFRRLFQKSSSNQNTVSSHDAAEPGPAGHGGGGASSSSPGSAREPEQEVDDHMLGSTYARGDICKACGFGRGSSVCCPVTHCHHGNDEPLPSGRPHHQHSRSSSGSKSIFTKLRSKLPVSSGRHGNGHTPVNGGGGTPTAEDRLPSALDAEETTAADGHPQEVDATCAGEAGGSVSPESVTEEYEHGAAAASHEGGEVQYYCYTDENGDTYYYTQELQESVQQHQSASAANMEAEAAVADDANADADADAAVPPGSYVCEYVDENGQTVHYLYTPEADASATAAPAAGEAALDATAGVSATSAITVTGSDAAAEDGGGATSALSKRKTPGAFFSAITSAFKSRGGGSGRSRDHHVDPAAADGDGGDPASSTGDSSAQLPDPPVTATGTSPLTVDLTETNAHDKAVTAFMEGLDTAERKRFLKERKSLIKDLASWEKKAREAIMRQRHEGVEVFGREKRSGAFVLRKDERVIKTGQKRGEPL